MDHTSSAPGGRALLLAAGILLLCLLASGAQALTIPMDDAALARGADEIVRGQVTGVRAGWNADHTNIVTTTTVRVKARIKGQGPETLDLAALGGSADGVTQWTEDQPVFAAGDDAYFFVETHPGRSATVYGGQQGVVPVANGRAMKGAAPKGGGIPVAEFDRYLGSLAKGDAAPLPPAAEPPIRAIAPVPVISSVVPNESAAGTGARVVITGSGFGTKASRESDADVAFLYRYVWTGATSIWASGYPYYADNRDEIVSWSDTRIEVNVPIGLTRDGYQGGASSGYVYVFTDDGVKSALQPFTVTFSYGRERWAAPASFSVNPGSVGPEALPAIANAAGSWNGAIPAASFSLVDSGTSTETTFGRDGRSLVSFGPASDFPDPGILAWTSTWTDASGNIVEADTEFNTGWTWTTGTASGSTKSVEAIALHELGHWLCLRDLYGWAPGLPSDVGKVMFGYNWAQFDNENLRTLHAADIAGIRWVYPDAPPLSVASIAPRGGPGGRTVAVTGLAGDGFETGATVALRRPGAPDISATGVTVVSPTAITCQLPLPADAPAGPWDVVVTNPGGERATLSGGFTVSVPETYVFVASWGADGSGGGQLHYPMDIAVDGAGNVYVAEAGTDPRCVMKYTSNGTFVTSMGSEGIEPGQFSGPAGVAVDNEGYVYVTDSGRFRVLKFTSTGSFVAEWGTEGAGDGQFYGPSGVAADGAGTVYVVDPSAGQKRVQAFTSTGTFLGRWDFAGKEEMFGSPVDLAVDGTGHVYVTDARKNLVMKFASNGALVAEWGTGGSGDAQFSAPWGVGVDGDGSVYVADRDNHRVQKFTSDGAFVTSIGTAGTGDGQFALPWDVAVDGAGDVYVVDREAHRVQKFARVETVPGGGDGPTDLDADGKYDDVNGNGRRDFADVVLYFNQMTWIAANEPVSAFDYNGNGAIDFADIVWLFSHL
ncbi:MAG: IPT/TIG domain-containing protein [Methanospirillum sp.]